MCDVAFAVAAAVVAAVGVGRVRVSVVIGSLHRGATGSDPTAETRRPVL
jgi:hypothetical protein